VLWMAQRYITEIWDSRNYQMTPYIVPTVIMAATLQFKREASSSFNSRFLVYYEVKQSSNYAFVKKPDWVQSQHMLDVVTTRTNEPAKTSFTVCFRGTYCVHVLYHVCHLFWFPFYGFFSMKSCTDSLNLNISQ